MGAPAVLLFLWDKIHDAYYEFNLPSADNNEFCPSLLGSGLRLAYPTWGIFSLNTAIGN